MKLYLLGIIMPIILGACASRPPSDLANPQDLPNQVGENLHAPNYQNIYFSGQPSATDIELLKKQGFSAVINLRDPNEHDEASEMKMVQESQMAYKNIPFNPRQDELSDEFLDEVTEFVVAHRKQGKVLVHCSTGNRAGLWAAGHFFKDHKYSKDRAKEIGQSLGLTKKTMYQKLESYFQGR